MTRSLNSKSASNHKAKKISQLRTIRTRTSLRCIKTTLSHEKRFTSFSRYRFSHVS